MENAVARDVTFGQENLWLARNPSDSFDAESPTPYYYNIGTRNGTDESVPTGKRAHVRIRFRRLTDVIMENDVGV